jgi:heavy metal translocating P-type ATPase
MKVNIGILIALILSLIFYYLKIFPSNNLLTIVGILSTIPVIISALAALKDKKVSVDLLASIALAASILHAEWASVAFINLMITSARIFGDYTEGQANTAIKSLLKLRPEVVKVKTENGITQLGINKVKLGDLVVIETGDRIPVDGKIIEGTGNLDQSSLTGESIPVTKIKGQEVLSSTLNLTGSFIMKTEKVGKDTTFEKIISLIQSAQSGKMGIQTSADKFASIYIVITLIGSTALFALTQNLTLILSILLVACADDIAVAIPMAFWGAIARAAKQGIIIKGGNFLEGLPKVKTLVVDKTGTLTRGVVKTEKIITFGSIKSHEALSLIAGAESVSEHPIAKAIILHAVQDGLAIVTPEKFEEFAGKGIVAYHKNDKVIAGNLKFIKEQKVKFENTEIRVAEGAESEGYDVVFLGYKNKLIALLTLADEIRPEAKSTIDKLKHLGIKEVIMLTGDNEKVAARVAAEVGITTFHANLLPNEKLNYVRKYLNKDGLVAYVGDGVNDAASLKLADIGIAMGAIGSDAAIESADIALMQDDFSKVVTALKLGKHVDNIAKQNFMIWGAVNIAGLFLVFTSIIGPEGAAAWNFVTDFFPIANSLRILRHKVIN